jgi:chemotaxis protein MotB
MLKREKKEAGGGTNTWMTTFTNLIILLLAFFIILVNMAVIDKGKRTLALNSLFGSFGIHPGGQDAIGKSTVSDVSMWDAPMVKEDIDMEKLQNIAVGNELQSDVEIRKEPEKIVIALSDQVLFDKGSSKITQDSMRFLSDLSDMLREGPGLIELRGYADPAETVFEPDPLDASLYLSTKRALAVLHFFVEKEKIPVHRIVAHGFGSPSMGKGSLKGKRGCRGQVEIILDYKQKIPYRLRVSKQRNRKLDFKGFLFKLHGYRDEK